MNKDEEWLLTEKYRGQKTEGFLTDCERLKTGEPLAYIIGSIPFLHTTIYLDSKPLIPRPETEFWTEQAIKKIKASSLAAPTVLDLCAGSGCIGVAVAKAIPTAVVHFAELDARHLPTIGKNLNENDISCTRYKVFQSDLFANVSDTYDFILSNPPYIDPALDRTQDSVKAYEPHHALYGGTDGLELITHIITTAARFLHTNGELWLEHEPEQTASIVDVASNHGFKATTHTDQFNQERYTILAQ